MEHEPAVLSSLILLPVLEGIVNRDVTVPQKPLELIELIVLNKEWERVPYGFDSANVQSLTH